MNNFNKQKIIEEIAKSSNSKMDKSAINKALNNNDISSLVSSLPNEDKQKITQLMNDKESLQSLLKNPHVSNLLNSFLNGGGK